jgi:hypothetical protein
MDPVRQIVQAVLYEGYLLWPYRQSALKNTQRWTFGGVYPERYGRARGGGDPWLLRTQCLIEAEETDTVDVRVCFLHVVTSDRVVGDRRYLAGEEATEREVVASGLDLAALARRPRRVEIDIPAGQDVEWLTDPAQRPIGTVTRSWQALRGVLEIRAERLLAGTFRLTIEVVNTTWWAGDSRAEALKRTLVSCHTVVRSEGGRFVSLMDPPGELRHLAESCGNVGTWPVLVGVAGERHTMLSSPIILYDYPQVAPESPGDLFDATEIDQLLTLSVLSLTDAEQQEIRDGDPRARRILDRCASLSSEQLMRLHGTMRDVRPVLHREPEA